MSNKYGARRTISRLCGREFASRAEAFRAEDLALMERAGEITELRYQVPIKLYDKPKVTITIDFCYKENGVQIWEDVKGMGESREFRVKRLWAKEKYGIDIKLTSKEG